MISLLIYLLIISCLVFSTTMHLISYSFRKHTWETKSLSLCCWFRLSYSPISFTTHSSSLNMTNLTTTIFFLLIIILASLLELLFFTLRGLLNISLMSGRNFPSPLVQLVAGRWHVTIFQQPIVQVGLQNSSLDVKELFDKPPKEKKRRSRYDIYKIIDTSYYGYMDDKDNILEKFERTWRRRCGTEH
jgi:hypothetical protein